MRFKRFLSKDDQHKIAEAVREATAKSSGKIVPAVVMRSSRYDWIGYRAALLGWIAASLVALWFYHYRPFVLELQEIELLQVAGMAVGWAVSRFPMGVRLLVPEHTLALEVEHAAHSSFLRHGLAHTEGKNGVLLYVSLRERRVLILADQGVHEKLGESFWKSETDRVVSAIRAGRLADGIVESVRSIGAKLAGDFPA